MLYLLNIVTKIGSEFGGNCLKFYMGQVEKNS